MVWNKADRLAARGARAPARGATAAWPSAPRRETGWTLLLAKADRTLFAAGGQALPLESAVP